MSLSKSETEKLLRLLGLTKPREIDCDNCLSQVAEFAEQQLCGKPVREGLRSVAQHLAVCTECREEFDALLFALSNIQNHENQRHDDAAGP